MNESDFENELRALKPTAPSDRLENAIARELSQPLVNRARAGILPRGNDGPFGRLLFGLTSACGGAAVAIVATVFAQSWPLPTSKPTTAKNQAPSGAIVSAFDEIDSSRELVGTEDAGLIYTEDQEPTRVVRYSSMERRVWSNAATGARVEVEMPREDLLLVPVSYQ